MTLIPTALVVIEAIPPTQLTAAWVAMAACAVAFGVSLLLVAVEDRP